MSDSKLDAIIFDLDGTLWDATVASALGWTRAARSHGHDREITPEKIRAVCGLPFDLCVDRLFGDLDTEALRALRPDLAPYEERAVRELGGHLYPGVETGLRRLATRVPLLLLSNCDRWYLELFLARPGVGELFRDDLCFGDTQLQKGENLRVLMGRHGLHSTVYVGDTTGDHRAATEAGCDFVYAAYGFGQIQGAEPYLDFDRLCEALDARV